MSRCNKYLSLKDKHSHLFDLCNFTIYTYFDRSEYGDWFSRFLIGKKVHVFNNPYLVSDSSEGKMFLTNNGAYFHLSYFFHFNFNFELFQFYKGLYGIQRYRSLYRQDNNVIASDLRLRLLRDGTREPQIRECGYELFFLLLNEAKFSIQQYFLEKVGLKIKRKFLNVSFAHVEACHDMLTAPRVELPENPVMAVSFENNLHEWKFKPEDKKPVEGSSRSFKSGGSKQRHWLVGEWPDGPKEKLYFKESGKEGASNRAETTYDNKPLIRKIFKNASSLENTSLVIKSERDFISKMNVLGYDAFARHMKIYNIESDWERKSKWKLFCSYCESLIGGGGWYSVYLECRKRGCVHTGTTHPASFRCAIDKVRDLANAGKLFRWRSRGVAVPDWSWVFKSKAS